MSFPPNHHVVYPQCGEIRQQPQPVVDTNTRHIPHLPDVRVILFSVAPLQSRGKLSGLLYQKTE